MEHLQPKMIQILARYRIPPDEAEPMLEDLFLTLHLKRESVRNPDRWLLSSLKSRCIEFWRRRREQFCRALDAGLLAMFGDRDAADEDEEARARLVRLVGQLPRSCRTRLEVRYGLAGGEPPTDDAPLDDDLLRCLTALSRRMVRGEHRGPRG